MDNDTICIEANLKKARRQWSCVAKILKREGANAVTMAKFYLTVVQSVLLYGAESWTPKQSDMKRLRSFHHRASRYMTGVHIKKLNDKEWVYPDHQRLLKMCGMLEIERYIEARRSTLEGYLKTIHPTLWDEVRTFRPPARNSAKVLWWKQVTLNKRELRMIKKEWLGKEGD